MNEQEWLECNSVVRVWQQARKRDTRRKFRLFLVACCRQVWHVMTDSRCRRAVEVAERFADGIASLDELSAARATVRVRDTNTTGYLARCVSEEGLHFGACDVARTVAMRHAGREPGDSVAAAVIEAQQARLLRDIFGNPFRPVTIDPAWLAWNDGTVEKIAQHIYDESAFDLLPILCDALEEAGCGDEQIIKHCRLDTTHFRGCWVIDLLLGKC